MTTTVTIMKSIAIFNNKGGVGKTTLLCNIAAYLKKEYDARVLVIDADPQCNATLYLFENSCIEEFYSSSSNKKTIYNIIHPYKKGKGYLQPEAFPIEHSEGFDIDCIIGDTRLAVLEDFISSEWIAGKSGEERGLDTSFVFKTITLQLAERYDYILFDIGPSLGAINRAVLLGCDYFVVPMSSDIFCIKAIENISEAMGEWMNDFKRSMGEYERKEHEEYKLHEIPVDFNLKFLGYVNQQYTIKKVDGKVRPVNAYDKIIRRMPSVIANKLVAFYPTGIDENLLSIGEIPNLHSLVPLSQSANKPIFKLRGGDGVVGAHFAKVNEFESVVKTICDRILSNIEAYDRLA